MRRAGIMLVLVSWCPHSWQADAAGDVVRRVLIVYENESTLPAVVEVAQGIRSSPLFVNPVDLEVYSDYLDAVRFPDRAHIDRVAKDMSEKYRDTRFDAVIAAGPGALKFVIDQGPAYAREVPLVYGGLTEGSLAEIGAPPGSKGVISRFDARKTIDLALRLRPDADRIVVVTGSSASDREWLATAREIFADRYRDIGVTYLSDKSLKEFEKAVAMLPASAVVLILNVFQDAAGRKFVPRDATARIAAASGAPAFTVYSSHLGSGVVGGFVGTFHAIGEEMGRLADQVSRGDMSAPPTTLVRDGPLLDWRQIRRWDIDRALVPSGAEIQNYQMTVWEQYWKEILAVAAVMFLLTATIVALVVQGQRTRRLEAQLNIERLELATLSRTSQLGELSGALAHELNQPLTSILANAEAGTKLLDDDPIDLDELRDILGDIVLDDRRAATVITQLRRLMLKGETSLEPLDFNQAVTATVALARSELLARQTRVELLLDVPEVPVRANLPQLQQVILNLALNAADAMADLPPSMREIEIQTRRQHDGFCELSVTDRGPGLSEEQRAEVFKPFVTTKKAGLGLGLAISRSIAQAHGGSLRFDENFKPGARVVFTLPAA